MLRAQFIMRQETKNFILIEDLANIKQSMSITNDAENVVEYMHNLFKLNKKRLFYIDTEGRVDELVHDNNGTFIGFAPGYHDYNSFDIAFLKGLI